MSPPHADRYRLAFRRIASPALVTDESFRVVDANDACISETGWSRQDLVGETPARLFDDPSVFETATDALEAGRQWSQELELRGRSGEQWHGRGTAAPLETPDAVVGYVFVFLDLTQRRQQEESLTVLNRVLRHNLRNDANVVLGHLRDVAETVEDDAQQEALGTAINRMEAMVDRAETTRRFGRLLAAGDDAVLSPVNVSRAVEQAHNTLDTGDAEVTVHQHEEAFILADETVTAAIRSLLDNAVQHTGTTPRVDVRVSVTEETVTVAVEDDGPGIGPADEDQVFSRNETDIRHGQGLSLFFVDRLMEIYGGHVELAESDLGGARFDLVFQRVRPE